MMESAKKYWIVMLLLVMVVVHASIIASVRMQAIEARTEATAEYDLGGFWAATDAGTDVHVRLHVIVPQAVRIEGSKILDNHRFQIREQVEEILRVTGSRFFSDPALSELKTNVNAIVVQEVGDSLVEKIVATEVGMIPSEQVSYRGFKQTKNVAKTEPNPPGKFVIKADDIAADSEPSSENVSLDGDSTIADSQATNANGETGSSEETAAGG